MANFILQYVNAALMRVTADEVSAELDLQDFLTFDAPGAKYMPAKRAGWWDGKVRLYNRRTHATYTGLREKILSWIFERRHTVDVMGFPEKSCWHVDAPTRLHFQQTMQYDLPDGLTPRDFQWQAVWHAITLGRSVNVLPTASGKSLVVYLLARWYLSRRLEKESRVLIVVPTIQLVEQIAKDFNSYNYSGLIHRVTAGALKSNAQANIAISTWQSIYKEKASYFDQYTAVICDEVHLFKSKAIVEMMGKMEQIVHRHGFSGTLDDTQVHELTLEGVFGRILKPVTTSELIERGILANLTIAQVMLRHSAPDLRYWTWTYSDEIKYLCNSNSRNLFLTKLAWSLRGRTLVLFSLVEHHGLHLYSLIKEHCDRNGSRPVYLIHGATAADEREMTRTLLRQEKDAILVASYGTLSTGVNIPELDNVIFASPSKSRIRVLQSLGRGLRLAEGKSVCNLYDIADDVPLGKKRHNFTFAHAAFRCAYYDKEKFPYKKYVVKLAS